MIDYNCYHDGTTTVNGAGGCEACKREAAFIALADLAHEEIRGSHYSAALGTMGRMASR